MMFLPYDKEEYLADRGLNFPYEEYTPGPKPETFAEFCGQMRELLAEDDAYVKKREEAALFLTKFGNPAAGTSAIGCGNILRGEG